MYPFAAGGGTISSTNSRAHHGPAPFDAASKDMFSPVTHYERLQELLLARSMSPNLSIQQERNSDHAFSNQSVDPCGGG